MALDAGGALPIEATACDLTVDGDFGTAASQWLVAEGNDAGASATAPGDFESAVPIVLTLNDERRMKQELVAWAKAVASMVIRASMHC
jgi:hypothetical protein